MWVVEALAAPFCAGRQEEGAEDAAEAGAQGAEAHQSRSGKNHDAFDAGVDDLPTLFSASAVSAELDGLADGRKADGMKARNVVGSMPELGAADDQSVSDFGAPVERRYTEAEEDILRNAKRRWTARQLEKDRQNRVDEFEKLLDQTRSQLQAEPLTAGSMPANRYGSDARLPDFVEGKHVPVLALINPYSGAMAGSDILALGRKTHYYKDRFFNIIDVVKDQRRGGLLDVLRIELCRARDEAKAMGTRARIISGGGDGTASFTLFILFAALRADDERADEGLRDSGNGFIWTDEEMAESFPALAQMPLGSANDFGHTLGWGQKYPGEQESSGIFGSRNAALGALQAWIQAVVEPSSRIANFDLFGIMPEVGDEECDFKLCELTGRRGLNPKVVAEGKQQLLMKEAGTPVPLFLCLYFSAGFAAYMTARFQINRRRSALQNKIEYGRQAFGIVAESVPPQLQSGLVGVELTTGGQSYFPPRKERGNTGAKYRDVGFLNINWQGGIANGADRAPACTRLCATREPAKFNDGKMDMYRLRFASAVKNPGVRIQTDKRDGCMTLKYTGGLGKGVFFQWDGEARFAFSPEGKPFHINIRKILNIPVVLGPSYDARVTGDPDNGMAPAFAFVGSSPDEQKTVRQRILRGVRSELNRELNATREEILGAGFQCEAEH